MGHGEKKGVINLLQEFSLPLIAGVILALLWANLNHHSFHTFLHYHIANIEGLNFHFLVNDIFMVFFFGIAAVEITQSVLPGGDLNPISKAVNPLMATVGGVLGPIAVFFILNSIMGKSAWSNGWGIPTATDIALAWLAARMVFGAKHPAVSFLLLLAIADDAIGLVIIAVFYPNPAKPVQPIFLLITVLAMLISLGLRKKKVQNHLFYLIFGGIVSWFGLFKAGVHPALALVFIVPFMPSAPLDKKATHLMEEADDEKSTIAHFEHTWKLFVDIGLLAFGLANAGVVVEGVNNLTWIILFALVVGKVSGVFIFSNIAILFKAPLPDGMNRKTLFVAGFVAALGLTVALFVSGQAFSTAPEQGAAKMGALLSAGVGFLAIILGKVLKIEKKN